MSPLPSESGAKPKKTPGSSNAKHKVQVDSVNESLHEKAVRTAAQKKKNTPTRAPSGEPQYEPNENDLLDDEEMPQSEQQISELHALTQQAVHSIWASLGESLEGNGGALLALLDKDESTKSKVRDIYTYICHKEHHTTEVLAKALEVSTVLVQNLSTTLLNITGPPLHPPDTARLPAMPATNTNASQHATKHSPSRIDQLRSTPSANPTPIKPSMAKKTLPPRPPPANPTQRGQPGTSNYRIQTETPI
jgi:hypothetical protein